MDFAGEEGGGNVDFSLNYIRPRIYFYDGFLSSCCSLQVIFGQDLASSTLSLVGTHCTISVSQCFRICTHLCGFGSSQKSNAHPNTAHRKMRRTGLFPSD
jgi:hypothetical protein